MASDKTDLPQAAPSTSGVADTQATLEKIAARIRGELAERARLERETPLARKDDQPAEGLHLARLAHELRTPLGAIAAMAEILRDEHLGPLGNARYRDYARHIHDSARHLAAIVDAMLDRETVAGARPPLTFVDLDIAPLIEATVASLQPLAVAVGVSLLAGPCAGLPRVVADQRCVRQVLDNLIGNALKFTPAGGHVQVMAAGRPGGEVSIEVVDTGPGMAAADLAAARAGVVAPGRRAGHGLGFGLPLVHVLAAANGARVEIDSAPQKGTRVALVFGRDRIVHV